MRAPVARCGWHLHFHQYRVYGLKQKLGEAIGKDLGLTETILKIESESSKMTYGELFELCNKSVENRTNLIVELRGLYPDMDYRLKTRLVDYLSAENEFVRAKREFYRKTMEQSSAIQSYAENEKSFRASSAGWQFYLDQRRPLREKVLEASGEALTSADEFTKMYDSVAKQEIMIAQETHNAGLRFDPVFQKHATSNQKRAKEIKDGALQVAKLF